MRRRGASFAEENIDHPDGVFILPRWSSLDVQIDFHVYYFYHFSNCKSSCKLQMEWL